MASAFHTPAKGFRDHFADLFRVEAGRFDMLPDFFEVAHTAGNAVRGIPEEVMEIRDQLPVHEVPRGAAEEPGRRLRIDGLVARPVMLETSDLLPLHRVEYTDAFMCEEGWTVPGLLWRGVTLNDVVALADPLPSARYVRVCAGDYAVPVPLEAADHVLLCNELNGRPLTREHGAPWRLLFPGRECFTSVKWVDRLDVTADPGPNDGERIARARLSRRASNPGRPWDPRAVGSEPDTWSGRDDKRE